MIERKYILLILLLAALTLLLSAFVAFGPLEDSTSTTIPEDWVSSTDPVYTFTLQHPADWALQPVPYKDWGWRLSSPDAEYDVMGRLTQGAFLSLKVTSLASFDPETYRMPIYHYEVSETTTLQTEQGQAWQITGKTAYSSQFADFLHYINGYLYHFSFQCYSSSCPSYQTVGDQILQSIEIHGAPTNEHQIAFEKSAVVLEDFSFTPLKHAFPAGDGRYMGDYDGHGAGGDNYAVDTIGCEGSTNNCWRGEVGQIALAQTDMKYVYTADANNDPDDPHDFHFFDLGLYGDKRYCLSYGHIYVYGIEVGDDVTRGAVVGTLSEYMNAPPHVHMGLYWVNGSSSDPEFQCARWITRNAIPYSGDFTLDGDDYPAGSDFNGEMTVSTNVGYCLGDPGNPPADLHSCIGEPTSPTALSPAGNTYTLQPEFIWTKVDSTVEYQIVVEEWEGSTANIIDNWVNAADICGETTCNYTHATPLPGLDEYVWAVRARNPIGTSSWSNSKVFDVIADGAPPRPTITSPTGQISDVTPLYTFENQVEAVDYRLFVSHSTVGTVIHEWFLRSDVCADVTCEIDHPTHLRTGNHAWWVQSRNPEGGSEQWSIPLNFKLLNTTPPDGTISPISPTGGAIISVNPSYEWNAVERASWYKVFIGSQTTGKVYNAYHRAAEVCYGSTCTLTPTEYIISEVPVSSLEADTEHNWYVMPVSAGGNGAWSLAQNFWTEP